MKKLISLILALVLALFAVSALAAGSKTNSDTQDSEVVETTTATPAPVVTAAPAGDNTDYSQYNRNTTTTATATEEPADEEEETEAELSTEIVEESEETAELIKEFAAALASGNIKSVFPAEVQAEIPEEYNQINEIITVKLSGDAEGVTSITVKYTFETPYTDIVTAGEKVILAYGIPQADGTIEWVLAEGTVQEDGSVNVVLDEELISKLLGKEVTLVVLNK